MRFNVLLPSRRESKIIHATDLPGTYPTAGLKIGEVDFGTALPGIGIVVYEYGLFLPVQQQSWFSIGRQLYSGNAVLYRYNEEGETVDFGDRPIVPRFYSNKSEVESAIVGGDINRPQISINNVVLWRWPAPHNPIQR